MQAWTPPTVQIETYNAGVTTIAATFTVSSR